MEEGKHGDHPLAATDTVERGGSIWVRTAARCDLPLEGLVGIDYRLWRARRARRVSAQGSVSLCLGLVDGLGWGGLLCHSTHMISSGSHRASWKVLSSTKGAYCVSRSSSTDGTVRWRGLTASMTASAGGGTGSVVNRVRQFSWSKRDWCAARLFRGEVRKS
jgi:hypothetical protein